MTRQLTTRRQSDARAAIERSTGLHDRRLPTRGARTGLARSMRVLLAVAIVAGVLTGCGGSRSISSSTKARTGSATTTHSTAPLGQAGGLSSVLTGPLRGRLRGKNHAPTVNRDWSYSVTVTDAHGRGLSGSVTIEFVYAGIVVGRDTPPTHPLTNGRWHDTLKFPAGAVGEPLTVRAVVHAGAGTITLSWPITVKR